eukprot:6848872-Ditylum_brightwellii.AAC.1
MNVMYAIVLKEGRIYTDQTGCFPVYSSKDSKYIIVLYCYDANATLAEPIKNRSEGKLLQAYDKMYKYLQDKGYKPYTRWLDNEALTGIKQYNIQNTTQYQLVPPDLQRTNAAERAIRMLKNITRPS